MKVNGHGKIKIGSMIKSELPNLLNVKEAAAFLNVSEMTIRRWTDAGMLPCYRVGKKRERRFSPQGLHEFLSGGKDASTPGNVPLGFRGLGIPDGSHLTHLYYDAKEALDMQVGFVRQGIESDEMVLVVVMNEKKETLLKTLDDRFPPVRHYMQLGKLMFSQGEEQPADMIDHIEKVSSSARSRFRLLGDMSWALKKGWTEEQLRALEEMTNRGPRTGNLFLCQYCLGEFSGRVTMMAVETHSHAIHKGRLKESLMF